MWSTHHPYKISSNSSRLSQNYEKDPTSSVTIATSSSTSQLLCAASTSCRSTVLENVNVHVRVRYMLSPVRLSSVYVRAPYSPGWNCRQYFFAIWYLSHPLTSTEILQRSSLGNPSVGGGVNTKGIAKYSSFEVFWCHFLETVQDRRSVSINH